MSGESLVSLDIETCCNVTGCKWFGSGGTPSSCDHALSPWHGKITKIGVAGDGFSIVFNNICEFNDWCFSGLRCVGHNSKFDSLFLRVHSSVFRVDMFEHCTQLMAYVLTDKIPGTWLEAYDVQRQERVANGETWHREAGRHSLKTLAPYFLGVEPFWELKTNQ